MLHPVGKFDFWVLTRRDFLNHFDGFVSTSLIPKWSDSRISIPFDEFHRAHVANSLISIGKGVISNES